MADRDDDERRHIPVDPGTEPLDTAEPEHARRIPDVAPERLIEAMHRFDRELRRTIGWSNWEQNGVHKYAIEWNGLRYPVKQIIRMATGASDFGGGAEANSYVHERGLRVVPLRAAAPSIVDRLEHAVADTATEFALPTDHAGTPSVWIFQANPKYYNLAEALKAKQPGDTEWWSAAQSWKQMQPGDIVLLWQSGPARGIYALGELVDKPYAAPPAEENPQRELTPQEKAKWRVDVRLTGILDPPLLAIQMVNDSVLGNLEVLRFPNATNFRVAPDQWAALQPLLAGHFSQTSWPPSDVETAFVVIHGRDDDCQQYGKTYCFSKDASGDSGKLRDAVNQAQAGGPPVYLIIYRPTPAYTFTAWAKVLDARETAYRRPDDRPDTVRWQLVLEQHEFPQALAPKGNAAGLMEQLPWLAEGLSAAFNYRAIRRITPGEFQTIITAARQDTQPRTGLPGAFARMRRDPRWQFQIQLRRTRAAQLRTLLADPDSVTLDLFNREVWVFASKTLLHRQDIGSIDLLESIQLPDGRIAELQQALDTGDLELHGNSIWGSGSRVYGAQLTRAGVDEKTGNIHRALVILNDPSLSPLQKARQIEAIPGLGPNAGTGLVMVFHPTEFAICNDQSQPAMKKLGYAVPSLEAFEDAVCALKGTVGAEDFLELDLFLWLVNNNIISVGETMSLIDAAYAVLQEEEGDPLPLAELLQRAGQKAPVESGQPPSLNAFRSALLKDTRFVEAGPGLWKLAQAPEPPADVDSGIWRVHMPRQYWREARAAGVVAIEWPPDSTNRSVLAFKRIKAGDRVVAYVQGGTIGGLGRVTRPYYDVRETPDGNQALFGGHLPQRIGVEWADALPEPVDLLDTFRSGEHPALYNRLKNPHTVVPLARDHYRTLLQLLGLPDDPFDEEEPQLPTAWAGLATYAEFARRLDPAGETPDAILARARAVDRIWDTNLDPTVDADALVDQLRQLRLLARTAAGGYTAQSYVAGDPTALRRLMALALLVREAGAGESDSYLLPARTILANWSADQGGSVDSFAPALNRRDAARLLDWYVEAGLAVRDGQTWQPVAAALQPVQGTDPAGLAYNEFLATLQADLGGTLRADLPPADGPLPAATDFDGALRELGADLLFDTAVVRRIYRSLRAGRHVILSGPPGTGKTELAKRLPALLWREAPQAIRRLGLDLDSPPVVHEAIGRDGYHPLPVTATEEWSVRDVVDGIAPQLETEDGKRTLTYTIRYGHVARAILQHYDGTKGGTQVPAQSFIRRDYQDKGRRYRGVWLVIDEFNRAPIDAAFGGLLTTLSGGEHPALTVSTQDGAVVEVPLPPDFRIIGTLNSFDRHFLNQISEAMKRRFDFIDILPPGPADELYEQGIAMRRALASLHGNGFGDAITVTGTPPRYRWDGVLAVEPELVEGVQRYSSTAFGEAAPVLDAFWRIFRAIRVFRLLGTAQAVAVYSNLFAGVLAGMSWPEALDAALADSLADQLQVLTRDEQRILLAFLEHGGDAAAFQKAVEHLLQRVPSGRQTALLRALAEADYRAQGTTAINQDDTGTLAGELGRVFAPGSDLLLPGAGLFRRRLRDLIGERGA